MTNIVDRTDCPGAGSDDYLVPTGMTGQEKMGGWKMEFGRMAGNVDRARWKAMLTAHNGVGTVRLIIAPASSDSHSQQSMQFEQDEASQSPYVANSSEIMDP